METEITTESVSIEKQSIPLLPLRDVVVFPHTVIPLFIGRKSSVKAITQAMEADKNVFLATQKDEAIEEPNNDDLHKVGTLATILQLLKLPDGTIKVLVEGVKRAKIEEFIDLGDHTEVVLSDCSLSFDNDTEIKAMMRLALENFEKYIKLSKKIPEEVYKVLKEITDIERFSDVIIANLSLKVNEKQSLLESGQAKDRLEAILSILEGELDMLGAEQKIQSRVRKQMESNQRDYYLNEQMKSIQKELGTLDDENEIEDLQNSINKAKMPKEAKKKAQSELNKLQRMSSQSSDASIIRTYIENLCSVPWSKKTKTNKDLAKAQKILDADHYGLDKVKERIMEHLAVQSRVTHNKANILCLVGPPGVGKTSLGESIARSVNRKYVRMALGGVRDEAEIRGHRRTYIGAMPGSIVQKMQKVNVKNPLFLLDEIDKMASDYRGDPSSAMLEVLDPEQNHTFNDHYLEVDYDLSQVMFVATANSLNLPEALVDRMEIIQLSGYTEDEKLEIAKRHLIAKQMKNNGVNSSEIVFKDSAIMDIIRYYTREAGVRNLDREIGRICRKVIKDVTLKKRKARAIINSKSLPKFLGMKKYRFGLAEEHNQIGEVTGLAWTSVGGDLLTIEASSYKGKGKLNYTGQLGDVMKESIQAAMSVTRLRAETLGISDDFHEKLDIHIHVPDGSTPKDGPSAGA
ncbi:MAG: endopeptidase La, partial [Thiotrichales bacterium]|nr:endopeptidase La [Thiotrichales bacterium]